MEKITVSAVIAAPIHQVWDCWTLPEHITQWNYASDDWHCPEAKSDLKPGGNFSSKMAAKDGSFEFELAGTFDEVKKHQLITYTMDDGRWCTVSFMEVDDGIEVTEVFDAETQNPVEMQQAGWQAILNNFKKYAESLSSN